MPVIGDDVISRGAVACMHALAHTAAAKEVVSLVDKMFAAAPHVSESGQVEIQHFHEWTLKEQATVAEVGDTVRARD